MCGIITGKARITTTDATTIENNVDFFSIIFSGLNKVIRLLNYSNLK